VFVADKLDRDAENALSTTYSIILLINLPYLPLTSDKNHTFAVMKCTVMCMCDTYNEGN
jgi:hypothetical protein